MDSDTIVTKGLVVRAADFGEHDKIITVLTEDAGKITVTVKGGKSLKSSFLSSSEVFSYSHFTFKKGKKFYYLHDSELIEDFYKLRESIEKISLGSYFCDLASEFMPEGIFETDILRLTLNALYALSVDKSDGTVIKGAYEFKASVLSGFMPSLDGCFACGKSEGVDFLDTVNGRLVCSDCLRIANAEEGAYMYLVPLTPAVLSALRFLCIAPIRRFLSFRLSEAEYSCFSNVCEKYMKSHVERDFYTLDFYKSLL